MYDWDDDPDLNITPLIDIMLVLMAIFMILAPSIKYQEKINLPVGSQSSTVSDDKSMTIRIDATQMVYFQEQKYSIDEFALRFNASGFGALKEEVVYLKADKSLSYEKVMQILAIIKSKGFTKISLLTE
ncbi:MAG: biopolymer transporter ExbD [Epsilonproteobacteria bacterium]|nr:biopolymer transporter ExbD [Campylobacterota bacterium]